MKIFYIILITVGIKSIAFCQNKAATYPIVGEKLQEYTFRELKNFYVDTLTTGINRRKWLLLDFWSRSCTGCVKSFPKMNKLHEDFSEKVDIVMIGVSGSNPSEFEKTKQLYEDKKKKLNLLLPYSFDSKSLTTFFIRGVPCLILLNPDGVVISKSTSIDSSQLDSLLRGEKPNINYALSKGEKSKYKNYNFSQPLLTSTKLANGGYDTAFIYRSLFTEWNPNMPQFSSAGFRPRDYSRYGEIIGVNAIRLIKFANTGLISWSMRDSIYEKVYPNIIYDTTNKKIQNLLASPKLWAYSITIPNKEHGPTEKLKNLSLDLVKIWGIESKIEEKVVPVYQLVVSDEKKIRQYKSRTQIKKIVPINVSDGFLCTAISMKKFMIQCRLQDLLHNSPPPLKSIPIIDKTNIDYDLDIKFVANLENYESVKEALNKIGLDIILTTQKMACITVEDCRSFL